MKRIYLRKVGSLLSTETVSALHFSSGDSKGYLIVGLDENAQKGTYWDLDDLRYIGHIRFPDGAPLNLSSKPGVSIYEAPHCWNAELPVVLNKIDPPIIRIFFGGLSNGPRIVEIPKEAFPE